METALSWRLTMAQNVYYALAAGRWPSAATARRVQNGGSARVVEGDCQSADL